MQKNKFIHEDIRAVCSSATKKLLAMGLVAAVGVSSQVYGSYTHTVSAQSFDHEISDNGNTLVNGDGVTMVRIKGYTGFTTVYGNGSTTVTGNGTTRVRGNGRTTVTGNGHTHVIGNGPTRVIGNGNTTVCSSGTTRVRGSGNAEVFGPINTTVMGNGNTSVYGSGTTTVGSIGNVRVMVSGGRSAVVFDNAPIEARGRNRIDARKGTTVFSSSSNLLTHTGRGAGDIDNRDIEFSGLSEDRLPRDVTVRRANSLTVEPGISTRIRNGTAFPMGETLQETAENILRALSPNSLRNIINRFANQNETGDEMKEERENNNTSSSQGGEFLSMINPSMCLGSSK